MTEGKEKYVPTKKALELLSVHVLTLHNWDKAGKIDTIRTGGGHRLYNVDKFLRDQKKKDSDSDSDPNKDKKKTSNEIKKQSKLNSPGAQTNVSNLKSESKENKIEKKSISNVKSVKCIKTISDNTKSIKMSADSKVNICYLRVSNVGDKKLLKQQKDTIKEKYPEHTIVEDIGSVNNFDKKGVRQLIDMVEDNKVNNIIIIGKNNMPKFGIDLMNYLLKKHGGGKVIIESLNDNMDNCTDDIIDELLQTITACSTELTELKKNAK